MERTQSRHVADKLSRLATMAECSEETNEHNKESLHVEDESLEEIIKALVENVLPKEGMPKKSQARDKMEDFVRKACKEPLYVGANVSNLRAMLSILNLEATFGWSTASVLALFEQMHKILPKGNSMPQS